MEPPSPNDVAVRRQRGRALEETVESPDACFAVLSSFNVDLISPLLVEALDRVGIAATARVGEFGHISQAILDPRSSLYGQEADSVLVVPAVEDMLAPLFLEPPSRVDCDRLVDDRLQALSEAVGTVLERLPSATCYVVTLGAHRAPLEHVLHSRAAARGQQAVERFIDGIRDLPGLSPRVVVVDWDWHVRAAGASRYTDDRLWYLARMRLNPLGLAALCDLVAGHVAAQRGLARKVVAVDLDDTLWGGVVGEVGLPGITLGEEGVGLAFQDLQRELVKLHDAGVILVACSKNNLEDAVDVFERHPAMVLRLEHLAAERINWTDKSTGLREIAAELGLGLDSFVFLDDNPVEREWVSRSLPDVEVPVLPDDPASRPAFLRALPFFQRITLTEADRQRTRSYRAEGQRGRLRSESLSFEDFLRTLEQEVTIESVDEGSLSRAVQLCQRTNQFNLTTRRHDVSDIERMLISGDFELYTLALSDRFADSGITGLSIIRLEDEEAEIETFLLSCRVLGRHVEDAFLAFVAARAEHRGARYLVGRYVPTAKNAQAADFYRGHGFEAVGDGLFRLALGHQTVPSPVEIRVTVNANA